MSRERNIWGKQESNFIFFKKKKKTGEREKIKRHGKPTTLIHFAPLRMSAINWWNRTPSPVPEIRLDGKEEPTRHEAAFRTVSCDGPEVTAGSSRLLRTLRKAGYWCVSFLLREEPHMKTKGN